MTVTQGRKGAIGHVAYSVPLTTTGSGFLARSSCVYTVVDTNEESVKRRLLDYCRTIKIRPCAFRHASSQCDYSGMRPNPSRAKSQESNADRWKQRGGERRVVAAPKPVATRKKVKEKVEKMERKEEAIDYSE
jgi:hypothetical protein